MKKIIYTLLTFAAVSCAAPQQEGFVIEGSVTGLEDGYAVLDIESQKAHLDSVAVKDGKFILKGKVDLPQEVSIVAYKTGAKYCCAYASLYVDNTSNVKFTADISSKDWEKIDASYKFTGAALNDEYDMYSRFIEELPESLKAGELREKSAELYDAGKQGESEKMDNQVRDLNFEIIRKVLSHKADSKASPVAIAHVCRLASDFSLDDQIKVSEMFDAQYKDSYYLNEFRLGIEREKKVAVGNPAADFKVQDLEGNEYTLASFSGKYLYLDFSASWCGWCHAEVPYIRAAYNKFKNENIVFVTMNMDDSREAWAKDVEKQKYDWLCLGDAQGADSELAHNYNIQGLPTIYILDPDGKIILKEVRREALIPTLEKLLK